MNKTIAIDEKTKELLDNCKIIPDERYGSLIRRLCEHYTKTSGSEKQIEDKKPSEEKNSTNFSDEEVTTQNMVM
jgi:hypothetical protein